MFLLYWLVIVNALFITGTTRAFSLKHAPLFALNNVSIAIKIFFNAQQQICSKYREALCLDYAHEE